MRRTATPRSAFNICLTIGAQVSVNGSYYTNLCPSADTRKNTCTWPAEVGDIRYNPKIVSYDELLEVFWKMHDPTTVDRQGKNVGPQYRSIIFYHTNAQRDLAEKYKEKLNATHPFNAPIVTEVTAFKEFYPAAKSHQDFFGLHPKDEYCTLVIRPKVEEFEKVFGKKLQAPPVAKTDRAEEKTHQQAAPRG